MIRGVIARVAALLALLSLAMPALAQDGAALSAANQARGLAVQAARTAAAATPAAYGLPAAPTALLKWRKAVARMRSPEGYRPLIAMVGDSKTAGVATGYGGGDSNQWRFATSIAPALAKVLSARGLPALAESMWGDAATGLVPASTYDPRRSGFSGWALGGSGGLGGDMATTTGTNPGTFTPSIPVDRVRVFYKQGDNNALTAAATVTADGGASLATLNGGSSPAYTRSPAIALGSLGTHAIGVTPAGSAPFYLAGMIAWNSAIPAVDIANLGVSGVKAYWQAGGTSTGLNVSPTSTRVKWLGQLLPDLTIINIGTNDMLSTGPTDIAAFTNAVQIVITAAKATGDVIIVFPAIGRDAASASPGVLVTDAQRAPFYAALQQLAALNGCVFVDEQALVGGRDTAHANGVFFDDLHENYWGTQQRAENLAAILLR